MEAAALAALLGLEVHSVVGLAPCSPPAPGGRLGGYRGMRNLSTPPSVFMVPSS